MAAPLSLIFDVLARDNASQTFRNIGNAADDAGKRGANFGSSIGGAMKLAAGAIAAAEIGQSFAGFVKDAQESARISRLTEQVVKTTGGAANMTAQQVNQLATAISNKTAVDDEAVQSASNLLLTFTKVRNETGAGNDIFNQATQAAIDMSVALGTDANGAALQLGKALNDPIKGVTALSRAGVSFTEQQKDQIKAMVAAGDTLGAQKIILSEMQTQFGGAAAAAADPLARLQVIAGNLGEEIGGALLPYVERFANYAVDTLLPNIQKAGGWIRDNLVPIFTDVRDVVMQAYDILFRGDFTGGPLQEDSKVVDALFRIRDAFITVKDFAVQAFNILFRGDFTGGPLQEDSFIVDALFRIREGAQWLADLFRDHVLPAVRDAFAWLRDNALPIMQTVGDFLVQTFQPSFEALVEVWNTQLRPALERMWTAFQDLMPVIGAVVGVLAVLVAKFVEHVLPVLIKIVGYLVDHFSKTFSAVATTIRWTYDNVIAPVFTTFLKVVETVREGFRVAVEGIGSIWSGLVEKVKTPVRIVFEFVNTKMIGPINGLLGKFPGGLQIPALPRLASGGPVRGPGTGTSDSIPALLSNGEYVIKASTVRALGVARLDKLNDGALALFSRGGLVGDVGGPLDFLSDIFTKGARAVAGMVLNPLRNAAKSLVPAGNIVGEVLRGTIDKLVDSVLGKSDEAERANAAGVAPPGGGSLGGNYQSLFAAIKRAFPQARLNSGFRPGDPGYHGRGKAADIGLTGIAGGAGNSFMAGVNRWLYDNYRGSLAELIYNGIGDDRPNIKNSRDFAYSAGTQMQHRNHVHAAVYDSGGILPPGLTLAYNGTGRDEFVSKTPSLEGAHVTGTLVIGGDGLARLVNGRIALHNNALARNSRSSR